MSYLHVSPRFWLDDLSIGWWHMTHNQPSFLSVHTLHTRVEARMRKKWIPSCHSFQLALWMKENLPLKKNYIVNLAVSSLSNVWTQFTIMRSLNLFQCIGNSFLIIFYILQVKLLSMVHFLWKKLKNSQTVLIWLIRLIFAVLEFSS